ncbi:MAG: CCA tRNA nucleotidyltransferase [Thermoplasmatota archaeon]
MELPIPLTILLVNLVLLAAGLVIFLPESLPRLSAREIRRLADKYGRYVLAALVVLFVHLTLVSLDPAISKALGYDLAPQVDKLEGGFVPSLARFQTPALDLFFSWFYLGIHPFTLYFAVLLFVVSDEERAAKATLLLYPIVYAIALPFYIFAPIENVYLYHHLQTPLFTVFPGLQSTFYLATSVNNTFPSLHVACALLIANAARYSRNRRFRYFAFVYAPVVVIATLYLQIHWLIDVLGGVLVAVVAGTLTARAINVDRLALGRVKPAPDEALRLAESAQSLVERSGQAATELGFPGAEPMLVGSVAKDTYLRNAVDIDVFVLFPPDVPREALERAGLAIGRKVLADPEEKYAEHPYTHGTWEGYAADLVPAYKVTDPARKLSAVDRTPFHTRLVVERMEREQRDQVRLLKQFMVGLDVYGAEAATRGFSGYLCELLVLKYKSFRGVVVAGAKWKPGTFLTLDTIEGNPTFQEPLVFIDPVDARRNVASAVSAETLAAFTEGCRAFLHREGLSYFFPRRVVPLPPDELDRLVRKRRGEFLVLSLPRPNALDDHVHDQARKAAAAIESLFARYDFDVRRVTSEVSADKVRILIELARLRLSEGAVHSGPPAKERDHAARFRKAWEGSADALSGVFEEDGRLKVKRRREFRRAEDLLRAKLPTIDIGKHLSQAVAQGFDIIAGPDVVREENVSVLTQHLARKKPWEL